MSRGSMNGSATCVPALGSGHDTPGVKTAGKRTEDDARRSQGCCGRTKGWFTQFPKATWPILLTEFGERFSYYGIKAVLVLYLTQNLMFERNRGKSIYHAFSMVSYFTGVLGALMADSWLGKYKTIAYTLFFYCLAEIVLTVTSVPTVGQRSPAGPLIGLFVMAIACGNIKPCLAAFGGDQFKKEESHMLELFFGMFYASVNVGAMLCMYFIPMVRTDIQCFGADCYTAVFGINAVLIIVAFVSFMAGKRLYAIKDPEGNVMVQVVKCICHAISNKFSGYNPPTKEHWLDYAQDEYDMKEINDIKMLLRVLVMYIPLPIFWALFHQQGSSWTLQAEQMDGDLGPLGTLRSDQIQALNPILVLILIPLYDAVIYPCFERCRLPLSALKKMTGGMFLAAVAFVICAFVQIQIQTIHMGPPNPGSGKTTVEFINTAPCAVKVNPGLFYEVELGYGERSSLDTGYSGLKNFSVSAPGCNATMGSVTLDLKSNAVYSILVGVDKNAVELRAAPLKLIEVDVNKAMSRVRILYAPGHKMKSKAINVQFNSAIDKMDPIVMKKITEQTSKFKSIRTGEFNLQVTEFNSSTKLKLFDPKKLYKLKNFGGFTLIVHPHKDDGTQQSVDVTLHEDAEGTSVSRLMQIPQYVVITAGEVMFSVTGLGFAYSQAPSSMKSVLQSFWLLTVAFGDLVVMILSLANPVKGIEKEMFMYSGVMVVITVIFGIMSYFYVYVEVEHTKSKDEELNLTNGIQLQEKSKEDPGQINTSL